MTRHHFSPFNSALETGVRALSILVACYPAAPDLNRLVQYDYLTVHSADANGPPSLHPALPLRSNEMLVRRQLVERGILLMVSAGLAQRLSQRDGFLYTAKDAAGAFLSNLQSEYLESIKERAQWVVATFDNLSAEDLKNVTNRLFKAWTIEFQPVEMSLELPT